MSRLLSKIGLARIVILESWQKCFETVIEKAITRSKRHIFNKDKDFVITKIAPFKTYHIAALIHYLTTKYLIIFEKKKKNGKRT